MLLSASHQPLSPFVAAFSQHHQALKYERRAFELLKYHKSQTLQRVCFHTVLKASSQLRTPCEEMWGKCVVMNLHTGFSHMEINTRSPPASYHIYSHWLYVFKLVLDNKTTNLNLYISVNLAAKKIVYFQWGTAVFFTWSCVCRNSVLLLERFSQSTCCPEVILNVI